MWLDSLAHMSYVFVRRIRLVPSSGKKMIVRKTGDKFRIFSINVTLSPLNYETR